MRPFIQGNEILINLAGTHGQIDNRHLAILALLLQVLRELGRQQLIEHVRIGAGAPTLRGTAPGQHNAYLVVQFRRRRFKAKVDEKTVLSAHHVKIVVKIRPGKLAALALVGLNVGAGEWIIFQRPHRRFVGILVRDARMQVPQQENVDQFQTQQQRADCQNGRYQDSQKMV